MNKINESKINNIESQVMNNIKSGKTRMHSRMYYLFLGIISFTSIMLISFATVYFSSVASLWLRIMTAQGPAYGAKQNLETLMATFPWWSLLLGILSLIIVICLIKRFGRFYKIKLSYLIISIVSLFIVIGFMASYSNLPDVFNNHSSNQTQNTNNSSGKKYQFGK